MFGLFNKQNTPKEEEKAEVVNSQFTELVAKWDSFLGKIDERFQESLQHAEEAVMENLVETNYDLLPTQRSWQSIKSQLRGLSDKIDSTFTESVGPKMSEFVKRTQVYDQENKGSDLSESIYTRIDRFEKIIEGKIALGFYDHAIQQLNEDFNCTQCGGKLEIKKDIFRSQYISCNYCNTVNTFTPSDKIAQLRWVVDQIANYNSLAEWDTLQKSMQELNDIRPPSAEEDKTEYEQGYANREKAEIAYWSKFLTERYVLMPEKKDGFEHDLAVKLKYFYEQKKNRLTN